MVNLVIDAGNTKIKVAVFDNRTIRFTESFNEIDPEILSLIESGSRIENAILSTVRADLNGVEEFLKSNFSYIRFNHESASPLKNHYKSRSTLGLDRLAAVAGAKALYPNDNCLVIDSGTCITYDFVDVEGNYYGGSISPGLSMRLKAMHTFTGKLPHPKLDDTFRENIGNDTRTALLSGVQNGTFYEAQGFINNYYSIHSNLKVLLCGGDYPFFAGRLKNSIFAPAVKTEPHLVLIGLNEIILRNANE